MIYIMSGAYKMSEKPARRLPEIGGLIALIKPITWFPPMWAYLCGLVSSGQPLAAHWVLAVLGLLLAGPIVCGMSQAANDWADRHVDAINEPNRPIPSGRVTEGWGLGVAVVMSAIALLVGAQLGSYGLLATMLAVLAAWAYSVEPFRLKRSGLWGPGLVGLSYETLPWITGAVVLRDAIPPAAILSVATLYGLGAYGIMILNDFKARDGDKIMGLKSLPVTMGPDRAARIACTVMVVPQLAVVGLLLAWGHAGHAAAVFTLVALQGWAMHILLRNPEDKAPWFNATGVLFYISGMMIAALALRLDAGV